jgi:hypothetical protein
VSRFVEPSPAGTPSPAERIAGFVREKYGTDPAVFWIWGGCAAFGGLALLLLAL